MYVAAMAFGSHLLLAADPVPKFDTTPSCRSVEPAPAMTGRTIKSCRSDEKNARAVLERTWTRYSASDKSLCNSLERNGGPPSYVELLSCLQMSREARNAAKQDQKKAGSSGQTTGAGGAGAGRQPTPEREP